MKRISVSITVAAVALVAAGCGSSADQQFTRDFNAAQQPLERLLTDVSSAPGSADPAKMERLADGLDDTAAAMRKLDAPSDAKDELDRFVQEVSASADVMRSVGKAVSGGKSERMTAALGDLQARMTGVASAQQALESAVN